MADRASPNGLKPVRRADGLPYAGAVTQYLIDPAGASTNLFTGQIVKLNADGYIVLDASDSSSAVVGVVGVFMGCEYVNAQGQLIHSPYYPSDYVAPSGTAIKASVVDDPDVLFQAQFVGTVAQSDVGKNAKFSAAQSTSTGNTATGTSTSGLSATTATADNGLRVMGFVSPVGDAYPDVLVKFNPGFHSLTNATGI